MIATEFDGVPALRLRSAAGLEATFAPGAGMVCASLRDGGEELLGQRRGLAAYVEQGRTMGVPLLHPWANRLAQDGYAVAGREVRLSDATPGLRREEHGLPIHGLLAGSPLWRVVEPAALAAPPVAAPDAAAASDAPAAAARAPASAPAASFAAELDYGAHPELLEGFPFPHLLRIEAALRERTLTVATTVTATGDVPVPLALGFHPYLRLPGVPRAEWRVELPEMRALDLDDRGIPTGASHPAPASAFPLADRALDDAYAGVAPGARFAVSGGGRRVEVVFERGWPAAQIFAPLAEDVVCFEPMAAPPNALVSHDGLELVAPGERAEQVFSIVVGADPDAS